MGREGLRGVGGGAEEGVAHRGREGGQKGGRGEESGEQELIAEGEGGRTSSSGSVTSGK